MLYWYGERNAMRFISVVIKTSSHTARFDETKKLYDYGFANFGSETNV
ncbi:D-alanyl-D-alanine carboxypeptidase [Bacillus thuringiensis serovar israelensis ATCC 35646]|nr:D-alanyl-D-alanine carboxypeptidase [Bacillus thuringiensis serovar israelensis ATCC 35646]